MTTKNVDDLLIFGYACKIFRDDEKALDIDQGRHLIPWMGDSTLKIDRYDVRAALTDIIQYEPPPGGYENRLEYLSAAEQRAEQLCEEERYFSLYNNDFEEELYKEENQKRVNKAYGQVDFNYEQSPTKNIDATRSTQSEDVLKDEQPDEAYVPHAKFYIPPNIELPQNTKLQAIIEKTARFISSQGPQMEILIKAKQANNPLFDFLNQSGRLNPFYKHTLQTIKDGNYPADIDPLENTPPLTTQSTTESIYQNYYLTNQVHVPAVKYKPSADCAYTQLISKIKGVPIVSEATANCEDIALLEHKTQTKSKNQLESNVEVKKVSSGLMLAQYYNSDSDDEEDNNYVKSNDIVNEHLPGNSSIQSMDKTEIPAGIVVPPPELRVIIDKTALYVLKNGKDFEDILREKNDQRFTFLRYKNPYYKYYTYKVTGIVCPDPIQVTAEISTQLGNNSASNYNPIQTNSENNKPIIPVSFSIKSKEDAIATVLRPALHLEQSSDEEMQQTDNNIANTTEMVDISQQVNQDQSKAKSIINNCDALNQSSVDCEQSDSFIRDTMLEQQNRDEKRQIKRAEDKVKDRLAQLAREKLGILSKEKQIQLERKKRAMAFLNQINGEEHVDCKTANKTEIDLPSTNDLIAKLMKNENESENSDSSDSVKFVMATASTTPAAATQTLKKMRNTNINRNSSDSDDVIEITAGNARPNSRQRSRSRSKSSSSRRYHHKSKHNKKHSKKHRNRSRSRSTRYSDYKRKRMSSSSKARKYRYSDD